MRTAGRFQLATMLSSLKAEKNCAKFILERLYFYFGVIGQKVLMDPSPNK